MSSYTLTWRFFGRPLFRFFDWDFGSKLHVGSISHSSNAFAILSSSWYFPESKMSSSSTNRTASLFCFVISRAVWLETEGPVPQVFAPALYCSHCFSSNILSAVSSWAALTKEMLQLADGDIKSHLNAFVQCILVVMQPVQQLFLTFIFPWIKFSKMFKVSKFTWISFTDCFLFKITIIFVLHNSFTNRQHWLHPRFYHQKWPARHNLQKPHWASV